jgi:hypothetical protein
MQETQVTTTETSSVFNPDLEPDRYGTIMVTHSGAKLASSAATTIYFQGSVDGTNWVDIEIMKVSDTSYLNGILASWCRVVPLAKHIRVNVVSTSGRNWWVWVLE